MPKSKKSVT